jgi:hypothetical protein
MFPKEIKCTDLNLWFGFKYNHDHPLLADDCFRVCEPIGIDWVAVFVIGAICTESFTKPVKGTDAFLTGKSGDIDEQLAAVAKIWKDKKSIEQLPGINNKMLAQFDVVYPLAVSFLERMAAQHKPRPMPEPPPPAPIPAPVPKPTPAPTPKPPPVETPKPPEVPPKKSGAWRSWLVAIVGVMGAAGWLVKMFLPGWAIQVWDTVKAVLEAIASGMVNLF